MVFHSISERRNNSKKSENRTVMASSSTLKSQLHNFSLNDLKWAMTNNHRLRKLSDSSHKSPQLGDTDSDSDNNRKGNPVREASPKNGAFSPDHRAEKSAKKDISASDVLVDNSSEKKATPSEGRSKICIRFRAKNLKSIDEVADIGYQSLNAEDVDELLPKTWNLRPRKPISKPPNQNGAAPKIGASTPENKTQRPETTRSRNVTEPKPAEKKEKEKEKKQKFSITLSREEIEDDIYAMTGSKPSRRPKKRAKNVQKQVDCVFPGLWLSSITPDCYRVSDAPAKGY